MKKASLRIPILMIASLLIFTSCSSGSKDEASPQGDGVTNAQLDPNADRHASSGAPAPSESYLVIDENETTRAADAQTIAFSLKVDTAAYTNVARYIWSGNLPPKDAVRTEELINYFNYEADLPVADGPFGIYTEIGPSPFDAGKYMAFIRVKTEDVPIADLPPCNLTFLIDTSGSMDSYDKLPLLKEAFSLLVETLGENDKVSIVTYAGSAGVVLDSASGSDKAAILAAINNLHASGSTAGAEGILAAYALAEKNYMERGNNRVILATDGDFNVGLSSTKELEQLVAEKRGDGVYLSILGFGTGNIRDDIMETLSAHGNGNYSYIGTVATAKKVLVDELGSNLYTVAEDVKAQLAFNPDYVESYRLIGYENRRMTDEEFEDDRTDAGEIGVGTDVVIMAEFALAEAALSSGLPIQKLSTTVSPNALFELSIRYKEPGRNKDYAIAKTITTAHIKDLNSSDFGFACSVTAFSHLLRGSEYIGEATLGGIRAIAAENMGEDVGGYRADFVDMLDAYGRLG